jgi:hypothetical protein
MTSDAHARPVAAARTLGGLAAGCTGLSLLIMFAMALNGPSVTVPVLKHAGAGPPWWHPFHFGNSVILLSLWAAAVIATAGVVLGLAAIARGARPSIKLMVGLALAVVAVFTVLPPAGSTDTVSYAIDGSMVVAGHSPYVMTPNQFLATGATIAKNSPVTWQNDLSDYGPLATASEWLAAELGGGSMARITFWLKLWTALSYGAVIFLLDWLLRADATMRRRAHLLWSLNPLMLWEILASGHIDGLAIAFGLAGIGLLWTRRPGISDTTLTAKVGLGRAALAGLLIGVAIAIKLPFAVYAIAAAWMLRRQLAALAAAAAGCLVVLIPSFALAGEASIKVYFTRGNGVTWDNLYQVFWRPFNLNSTYEPNHLVDLAALLTLGLVVLLIMRLPQRTPQWPAVPLALALSLAWIFLWPFQRPWYDVMIIGLLALYPASRLDWVVLGRLGFAGITYMDAITLPKHSHLAQLQHVEGEWITSTARLIAVIALLWLCITGRWGWRSSPAETSATTPELQRLT